MKLYSVFHFRGIFDANLKRGQNDKPKLNIDLNSKVVIHSSNHVLARFKTDADNPVQGRLQNILMYVNYFLSAHFL